MCLGNGLDCFITLQVEVVVALEAQVEQETEDPEVVKMEFLLEGLVTVLEALVVGMEEVDLVEEGLVVE